MYSLYTLNAYMVSVKSALCVFDAFRIWFLFFIATIGDEKQGDDTARTSDFDFSNLFLLFLLFWLPILGVVRAIGDAKQGDDTRKDDCRSCQVCNANCFAIGENLEKLLFLKHLNHSYERVAWMQKPTMIMGLRRTIANIGSTQKRAWS